MPARSGAVSCVAASVPVTVFTTIEVAPICDSAAAAGPARTAIAQMAAACRIRRADCLTVRYAIDRLRSEPNRRDQRHDVILEPLGEIVRKVAVVAIVEIELHRRSENPGKP